MHHKLSTSEKALAINHDPTSYGTFAEIGAGQEVARWFFRAGNASRTVAKTMSAYDMTFSDAIYGAEENNRYVCEGRLHKMLAKEYGLLLHRLGSVRGATTRFFAFADTMASKRADSLSGGHGWMGVRFQHEPMAPCSDAVIHIRMLDRDTLDQQEAVGIVGVNLLHGCLALAHDPVQLVRFLKDGLERHVFEVDMIQLAGPAFEGADNRLLSLHLVESGLTDAVVFAPDGRVLQPADAFYGKQLLVQRGRFNPLTHVHVDMLERARAQFLGETGARESNLLCLLEITTNNLLSDGNVDVNEFLERVNLLGELGYHVMISNYAEYHRLSEFLVKYTREKVGIVMGVGHLSRIFDESYYQRLPGGIMAALGNLFRPNVRALVYPAHSLCTAMPSPKDFCERKLLTASAFAPPDALVHLYRHLVDNRSLEDIREFSAALLAINSEEVLDGIRQGDASWQTSVPELVARRIVERGLFGYAARCPEPTWVC